MEMNDDENVQHGSMTTEDGTISTTDRSLGRLLLPCRRRIEDLWTLVTRPGEAPAGLAAHAVGCRFCAPQMERLGALIDATSAMRAAPIPSPEGFLDRVMTVVSAELRGGPDIRLLPEPARATVSTAALLSVVRRSLAVLSDLGDEFRLRRSKVSESAGTPPAIDLVLAVELAQDADEGEWRGLVVSAVTLAVDAEIGLAIDDVDLDITFVPRSEGSGRAP